MSEPSAAVAPPSALDLAPAPSPAESSSTSVVDYADESLYVGSPVDLSRIPSPLAGRDVFLCNFATSLKVDVLQSAGIRSIVFLHYMPKTEATLRKYEQAGIAHHYIVCYDSPYEKIAKHIDAVVALLSAEEAAFPVLFHCQEGISRSPALVIAWIMHSEGLSYAEAKARVKAARSVIRPNEGFEKQLRMLEQKIKAN